MREEEHKVKNEEVVVEMRQEKVSKGQGEDVTSQSELDDSCSDLKALLEDSDPDSE